MTNMKISLLNNQTSLGHVVVPFRVASNGNIGHSTFGNVRYVTNEVVFAELMLPRGFDHLCQRVRVSLCNIDNEGLGLGLD